MFRDFWASSTPRHPPPHRTVSVRSIAPAALDDRLIAAWQRLSEHAVEPNAYLTPMFIMPALTHLGSALPVNILLIETAGGELVGVGVFNAKPLLPFSRLQSLVGFRSRHSYLTGLLIDREQATAAIDAFFDFVSRPGSCWHGVRFDWLNAETALGRLLIETARRRNIWWSVSERMRRAVLLPKSGGAAATTERISKTLMKKLQRSLRRLRQTGSVDWRLHCGTEVTAEVIERFLALEHMGWKGEAGTSIRSSPAHEQFFKSMIADFRNHAGGVFFTELLHGGRVIASTCNLISGNCGFAFKIGWDPACASCSPGLLNELGFLEMVRDKLGNLDLIDSGAVEGAYIDKLWLDRRQLVSGVFATTWTGKLFYALAASRRRVLQIGSVLRSLAGKEVRIAWPPLVNANEGKPALT